MADKKHPDPEPPKPAGTQSGPTGLEGRPIKGDPEIPYNPDKPFLEAREDLEAPERSDTRTAGQGEDVEAQRAEEARARIEPSEVKPVNDPNASSADNQRATEAKESRTPEMRGEE